MGVSWSLNEAGVEKMRWERIRVRKSKGGPTKSSSTGGWKGSRGGRRNLPRGRVPQDMREGKIKRSGTSLEAALPKLLSTETAVAQGSQ